MHALQPLVAVILKRLVFCINTLLQDELDCSEVLAKYVCEGSWCKKEHDSLGVSDGRGGRTAYTAPAVSGPLLTSCVFRSLTPVKWIALRCISQFTRPV